MLAPATACASGLSAIGDAFTAIKYHRAKVMLAGGTEASVHPVALTGFKKARALSSIEDPQIASRPFDKKRDGFVLSEGAGILLLEVYSLNSQVKLIFFWREVGIESCRE